MLSNNLDIWPLDKVQGLNGIIRRLVELVKFTIGTLWDIEYVYWNWVRYVDKKKLKSFSFKEEMKSPKYIAIKYYISKKRYI